MNWRRGRNFYFWANEYEKSYLNWIEKRMKDNMKRKRIQNILCLINIRYRGDLHYVLVLALYADQPNLDLDQQLHAKLYFSIQLYCHKNLECLQRWSNKKRKHIPRSVSVLFQSLDLHSPLSLSPSLPQPHTFHYCFLFQ